jgi:hypothetical protein
LKRGVICNALRSRRARLYARRAAGVRLRAAAEPLRGACKFAPSGAIWTQARRALNPVEKEAL